MELFHQLKTTGAVLLGIPGIIDVVADKGAEWLTFQACHLSHGNDLIDNTRELRRSFAAFNLLLEIAKIKIVNFFVEDAEETDILAACALKMGKPHDHFLIMRAISATRIRLSGFLGGCLRLTLIPAKHRRPATVMLSIKLCRIYREPQHHHI